MAKLTGPLLSFGAQGQIGKSMVTASWRGVKYARQYVIPNNPQTVAQQANRKRFAYLREMWKRAPAEIIDTWNDFAKGRPFTGMNKWVGENVRVLNGETDLDNIIFSPGSGGGLIMAAQTAVTGGSPGTIDWTAVAPTAPAGWTVTRAIAVAVPDADPATIFDGTWAVSTDNSSPFAGTLSGLGAGTPCQVGIWLEWEKPNGLPAYSASVTIQANADS